MIGRSDITGCGNIVIDHSVGRDQVVGCDVAGDTD